MKETRTEGRAKESCGDQGTTLYRRIKEWVCQEDWESCQTIVDPERDRKIKEELHGSNDVCKCQELAECARKAGQSEQGEEEEKISVETERGGKLGRSDEIQGESKRSRVCLGMPGSGWACRKESKYSRYEEKLENRRIQEKRPKVLLEDATEWR